MEKNNVMAAGVVDVSGGVPQTIKLSACTGLTPKQKREARKRIKAGDRLELVLPLSERRVRIVLD